MQTTGFTRLTPSERIELSDYSSTANSTHLLVDIHNINKSDAGAYKCMITWPKGDFTSSGHVTNVTVNPGGVHSPDRNLYHRVLLCLSASMCFPLVLGLVWCLTRDHPSPPPVPPRSYTSFAARVKPKKEVSTSLSCDFCLGLFKGAMNCIIYSFYFIMFSEIHL
ncbi:hypothetical protein DPX16_6500 [Anabarilius grahami]|uniref:Ig-like domain-containing protein n=1 Tax=Anabarilius grahami TaxID=495550 RepID=A0A3N0XZ21_ANAGA|nr:hypothetical protein DPX16_6500 [Anabarilius grahami]